MYVARLFSDRMALHKGKQASGIARTSRHLYLCSVLCPIMVLSAMIAGCEANAAGCVDCHCAVVNNHLSLERCITTPRTVTFSNQRTFNYLVSFPSSLVSLNLSGNAIRNIQKNVFATNAALNKLDLSYNRISNIDVDAFQGLTNLAQLYLQHNSELTELKPGVFTPMQSLIDLHLEYCGLRKIDHGVFSRLLRVQTIVLNNNNISAWGNKAFYGFKALSTLILDNNPFRHFGLTMFWKIEEIRKISMDGVPLDYQHHSLCFLVNLKKILKTKYTRDVVLTGSNLRAMQNSALVGWVNQPAPNPYFGKYCDVTPCTELRTNATLARLRGPLMCSPGETCRGVLHTYSCHDINECQSSSPCHSNAQCQNTYGSYTCTCNAGYSGNGKSCTDIDECLDSSSCHLNAACENKVGSYSCTCNPGYVGDGRHCNDVNECQNSLSPCPHTHSTCNNTAGSYVCGCVTGYHGNETFCRDVDECNGVNPCSGNHSICNNTQGSYVCQCALGFTGDGRVCSDLDECSHDYSCHHNATCSNIPGSYQCVCIDGFKGNSSWCGDNDECVSGTHLCNSNAVCVNSIGGHSCTCHIGYTGDGYQCDPVKSTTNSNNAGPPSNNKTKSTGSKIAGVVVGVIAAIAGVIMIAIWIFTLVFKENGKDEASKSRLPAWWPGDDKHLKQVHSSLQSVGRSLRSALARLINASIAGTTHDRNNNLTLETKDSSITIATRISSDNILNVKSGQSGAKKGVNRPKVLYISHPLETMGTTAADMACDDLYMPVDSVTVKSLNGMGGNILYKGTMNSMTSHTKMDTASPPCSRQPIRSPPTIRKYTGSATYEADVSPEDVYEVLPENSPRSVTSPAVIKTSDIPICSNSTSSAGAQTMVAQSQELMGLPRNGTYLGGTEGGEEDVSAGEMYVYADSGCVETTQDQSTSAGGAGLQSTFQEDEDTYLTADVEKGQCVGTGVGSSNQAKMEQNSGLRSAADSMRSPSMNSTYNNEENYGNYGDCSRGENSGNGESYSSGGGYSKGGDYSNNGGYSNDIAVGKMQAVPDSTLSTYNNEPRVSVQMRAMGGQATAKRQDTNLHVANQGYGTLDRGFSEVYCNEVDAHKSSQPSLVQDEGAGLYEEPQSALSGRS